MKAAVAIFLGGGLGALARCGVSRWVAFRIGETFPWGTLAVNASGCFVIGLFAAATGPDGRLLVGPLWRQFVTVGLLGGYTTFSSFALQTLELGREGELGAAAGNCALSVGACLLGVWLGHAAGTWGNLAR